MRGVKSEAMVLVAAHPTDESRKELLDPPAGSQPGDKVYFEGHIGEPDNVINLSSKGNIFSKLQPVRFSFRRSHLSLCLLDRLGLEDK
ncbi:hypothetical protein M1146_06705 [Patescibacteria group bacterium]|nr:hypothetical protein [Patescibacteria group bacterium]